ncbi:hypothetical protein DL96DRAFT_1603190 [Flagelloscypha sp. PMI_526]|nr:hypothetical protein DL96DRAFT_1603190 [Flagelloscypha sp. PMI_526]
MSKTSSNSKVSQKSAWARGPPSTSNSGSNSPTSPSTPIRPSSPSNASRGTHSRKPSQLSQQIGDGVAVSIPGGPRPTHQSRGSVNFGTINDAGASNAPVSSSPASVPPIRSEGVMSFGQLPATPTTTTTPAATASAPAPGSASKAKFDFKKLFQNSPGTAAAPASSSSSSPTASATNGSSPSPSAESPAQSQSNQAPSTFRSQQNGAPRSPVHHARQMPNGSNPPRPSAPPQAPAGMPSQSPVPQPQMPGMPPQGQVMHPGWPGTYYAYDPNYATMYGWGYMPHMQPGQPMPGQPIPGQPIPGQAPNPMSPRTQPLPLAPSTPTMQHSAPAPAGHPAPVVPSHSSSPSMSSTPLTPASPSTQQNRTLNPNASGFIPNPSRSSKISFKKPDGSDFNIEEFRPKASNGPVASNPPAAPSSPSSSANRRSVIRMESEDAKRKRLAEEQEKENKARAAEEKKKKDADAKKKAEEEEKARKAREEEEKKKKAREEEEEKKRKEEEERKRKEEEARKQKEKEEEEERKKKEKEEEERKAKEEQERKDAEERERARQEEEKRIQDEAAKKDKPDVEDGEIKESPTPEPKKLSGLRIDTETSGRKSRPGPLDLSGAKKSNVVAPLPSALSKAKQLSSIDPSMYPEGIKSPKIELNMNAKEGKFRYDRSGRHRNNSNASVPQRAASVGLGISGGFGKGGSGLSAGGFGNFSTAKTSEERFVMSSRSSSVSGMPPFGRQTPLTRTASQGGPGHNSKRTRSQRGKDRPTANPTPAPSTQLLEPVAPLSQSANAWNRKALAADANTPELVERKVKSLLNKLTMEKFDSISDQIIGWANKSEKEKDGRTLIQVIRLVFEKATDEAAWSEMYARLCRKMMEQISSNVQDDGIKNAEGKPITGGQLFRKYLLNRCQEDFERGWVQKEATAAAAAIKSSEDEAAKAANEKKDGDDDEIALYSEEVLGLIRFIGELFKLQMLTERIMHECVKKLLGNVDTPEEEEIESLCKLLTTVGQILDTPKAKAHMDVYFSRMQEMTRSPNVSSRMHFMLQDVIELRDRKWVTRSAVVAPTTLSAVHSQAAKEQLIKEKESLRLQTSMSRGGSRRGGDRGDVPQVGPDGWSVAGSPAPRPPAKAGDLSNFGKIAKSGGAPMSFGPSSVFNKKDAKRESVSRTSSSSNMFSMLQNSEAASEDAGPSSKGGRPGSRKPSVDLGSAEPDGPPQRRKLALLPRTKPLEASTPNASRPASEDGDASDAAPEIAKTRKNSSPIRNIDEAESYFTSLPPIHHSILIDQFTLVAQLFGRAMEKKLVSSSAFETAFSSLAEFLEDIAIDAPKAFELMAIVVSGPSLDSDATGKVTSKDGSGKLAGLLAS